MANILLSKQITSTKEVYVAPCIKCGGDNISIDDCGYSSFNVAYGKCLNEKCKHKETFNCGCNIDKESIIEFWNSKNDFDLIIAQKNKDILKLKDEIKELKKLKKTRKIKKNGQ